MGLRIAALVINAFTHDTRVQKEAKALARAGYRVRVFALHGPGLPREKARDGYTVEWIHLRSRPWGTSLAIRLLKYLEFCVRAVCRICSRRPDVVHAHDVNALVPAYVAARLCRARLVYDAHELWAERRATLLRSNLARRLVRWIEGVLSRRADAVVTVNPSIAGLLARQYHIPTPVVVMHCQEYQEVERNDVLRRELGIPPDRRIVIYAGLFAPGRGLETLVEAAGYLDQAVVVLMGKDGMNGRLQRLVAERGLRDRVFIRAPVSPDDVTRYLASADVGVMPTQDVDLSYHYSAGNKLFHYLMAGIPVAVSDQPEKRRIVETYGVGVVFDQTDPRSIACAINALLEDEATYRAMCERARRAVREVLNWDVEARKLLDLYEGFLSVERKEMSR